MQVVLAAFFLYTENYIAGVIMLPIFLTITNEDERRLAEHLYLTYKSKMYNIAFSILRNKEDAEDAVMDSVYKIVKNISVFGGIERNKTESLIVIIVRNTAINRYNYNKYREYDPIDGLDNSLCDDAPIPAEIAIEEEAYGELLSKIRSLEPIYRDVLLMKCLYEYDNGRIAALTGVSETTVRVRFMRAKKLLGDLLKGGAADE